MEAVAELPDDYPHMAYASNSSMAGYEKNWSEGILNDRSEYVGGGVCAEE
jgi:hypothetical protein